MQNINKTEEDVLAEQMNSLEQQIEKFTIKQDERYAILDGLMHFATPKFTNTLIALIRAIEAIEKQDVTKNYQSRLQQVLFKLNKKLKEAEAIRNIENNVKANNEGENEDKIKQTQAEILEDYKDLDVFKACIFKQHADENKTYLLVFRYCFPADGGVYDIFFPEPDTQLSGYIKTCKEIRIIISELEKLHISVFNIPQPDYRLKIDASKKRKLEFNSSSSSEEGTIKENKSYGFKRSKQDI